MHTRASESFAGSVDLLFSFNEGRDSALSAPS